MYRKSILAFSLARQKSLVKPNESWSFLLMTPLYSGSLKTLMSCGCVTVSETLSARPLRSTNHGGNCTWGSMMSVKSGWGCSPRTSPLHMPTNQKVAEAFNKLGFCLFSWVWILYQLASLIQLNVWMFSLFWQGGKLRWHLWILLLNHRVMFADGRRNLALLVVYLRLLLPWLPLP